MPDCSLYGRVCKSNVVPQGIIDISVTPVYKVAFICFQAGIFNLFDPFFIDLFRRGQMISGLVGCRMPKFF